MRIGLGKGGAVNREFLRFAAQLGVQDVVAKSLGSSNYINIARATIQGLESLRRPDEVAALRGIDAEEFVPGGLLDAYKESERDARTIKRDGPREVTVLLSHYHWDHISGLPFFVPAFLPGWHIDFWGPADTPDELRHHLSQQMKAPYFPVETETWLADIGYHTPREQPLTLGPVTLRYYTMHHPGLTYAYRLEVNGKVIVYAPDNELAFIRQSIDDRIMGGISQSQPEFSPASGLNFRGNVSLENNGGFASIRSASANYPRSPR